MTRSDGLNKVILQGTVEGKRRRGLSEKEEYGGLTKSRSGPENIYSRRDSRHGTLPAGVGIADEEVRHDAPLRLLAEPRNQDKARQAHLLVTPTDSTNVLTYVILPMLARTKASTEERY